MTTRRDFLRTATLATAAAAAAPTLACASKNSSANGATSARGGGGPKRVIFLVSDGMSQAVPTLAEQLSLQTRGRGTHFCRLLAEPGVARGLFETHSLNSLVTDSAAASTAWGSGSRVFNGSINVLPDGTRMTPVLPLLKDAGYGTGLVTTSRVTHATPAGFATVAKSRGEEDLIATQFRGVADVLMGGGTRHFDPDERGDGEDLYRVYSDAGYALAKSRGEMLAAPEDRRLLGLFYGSHLPYTIDHTNSDELRANVPTLAEMTEKALAYLEKNPRGFLLQVEGARIDHAAHGNDAAAMVRDQIAFDDAVGVALEFQRRHPDTLVVVTSDHGNANPALNGMGGGYLDTNECFRRLAMSNASFGEIREAMGSTPTPEQAAETILRHTGIELNGDESAIVADARAGKDVGEINKQHQRFGGILGQVLGNHTGLAFTGSTHTEDLMLIAAQGPGQEAFGSMMPNTAAFEAFAGIFGLTHRNPSMQPDQAEQYATAAPRVMAADWA